MTTDKERAEVYRELADELPTDAYWDRSGLTHKADLLDPPKPQWPDGTIAWVTANTGKAILSQRINGRWDNYRHVTGATYPSYVDSVVTKVEPLRVLGDDEIAIKRTSDINLGMIDTLMAGLDHCGDISHRITRDVLGVIRYALDAEAGGQS